MSGRLSYYPNRSTASRGRLQQPALLILSILELLWEPILLSERVRREEVLGTYLCLALPRVEIKELPRRVASG